jgi:hypothetical protein
MDIKWLGVLRNSIALLACSLYIGVLPVSASPNKIDTFINEGLPFFSLRAAPSKIRGLKGLLSEKSVTTPNKFEPSLVDTYHSFLFQGLEVWLQCPPNEVTDCFLMQVKLSRPGYRVKFNLGVGTSTAQLIAILGEPHTRLKGEWVYEGESSSVAFQIMNGRVAVVQWDMYTG